MRRHLHLLAWLPAALIAAVFLWTSLRTDRLTPLQPVPVQLTAGESVDIAFASSASASGCALSRDPDIALFEVIDQQDDRIVCRLTAQNAGQTWVSCAAGQIESPDYAVSVTAPAEQPDSEPTSGAFVASASGEKYHLATCASARQIKEENRVYFQSASQAEENGYTPCARCLPS